MFQRIGARPLALTTALLLLLFVGCNDSTEGAATGYAELAGDYIEPFPGGITLHTIGPHSWTIDLSGNGEALHRAVVEVDDDARWVVLESVALDGIGTFTRNDWTFDEDGLLRSCTAAIGAATAEDAIAAAPSDADDLDGAGCRGMFPWSALEPTP